MRAHNSSGTIHGGCWPFLTDVLNHHTITGIPTRHSVSSSKRSQRRTHNASPDPSPRSQARVRCRAPVRAQVGLSAQDLLSELLERTRDILQADTAEVLLLDFSSGELIATAAAGLEEVMRQGVRIPVGRGFAGRIAAERKPVILDHVDHTTVLNPILSAKGIRALMGVPLIAGGRVIGVLHVGSLTPREFTAGDVELLQLAADRAATAVQSLIMREDQMAAAALQRSLLPSALPASEEGNAAAHSSRAKGRSGGLV